ncbi:hypothetical protein [Novosphingobium olei]|uniref:hypothetical protein n=1 Tax=Novosphingobium olei TaxID=2728851 RepID=UPI0030CF6439
MKRLEPLDHIEMRAFLRAFAKTTLPMLLLYHTIHYSMRVLFWHHFSFRTHPQASGKIQEIKGFSRIWRPPASG